MKLLQDLVPGCNKVTGKAVMLEEIINYVQSLQRQVEFLSIKLSTLNSRENVNTDNLLSKNMFQPNGSFSDQLYPVESSASAYYGQQTPQVHNKPVEPLDATLCRSHNNRNMAGVRIWRESCRLRPFHMLANRHILVAKGFLKLTQGTIWVGDSRRSRIEIVLFEFNFFKCF